MNSSLHRMATLRHQWIVWWHTAHIYTQINQRNPLEAKKNVCKIQMETRWRHQMEAFSALLAICAGNSPVTGEFPTQRPVTRSFDISLICAWINGWVNNGKTADLGCHRVHYEVTIMNTDIFWQKNTCMSELSSGWVAIACSCLWF